MAQIVAQFVDFGRGIFHGPLIYNLTRKPENLPIIYQNIVLIYNPKAGRFGRGGGLLVERAVKILAKQGGNVKVAPTTGPGTAGALARAHIETGADLIVVAGGDGTINEVVEGMVHSAVPLAILPGGTANVLAMEMGLGKNLERVAGRLPELKPHRISLGHVTCDGGKIARHFVLMAGIGVDAHIVYNVDAAVKARTGKLAYWLAGFSLLGRKLAPVTVVIDGQARVCSFALLSRVRNYGGDFEIARSVSLFDHDFEVVLFEGESSIWYMKYLVGMALNRLTGMKGVNVLRTDRVALGTADMRVYVQIDGELAGHLPAEIRIVPDALTLLIPEEYERRL
ncbi:MAG TPA: diacylglycerol kinase family protein [Bryobacteraceae bacterium]|nr:diacylglycerol kinase family protein [Bryobacteraceae bacterium]